MGTLIDYLADKSAALADRLGRIARGEALPTKLHAKVSAEGRSGVRRIRIRGHQVLSDSPPDFAGFDLGATSPELQLGVLGSCVTHIALIQAAERKVPVAGVEVEVHGTIDPRGGRPGYEHIPVWPHDIGYTLYIDSPAPTEQVQALFEAIERSCPILNLLRNPQTIRSELRHTLPVDAASLEVYAVVT